jgi:hypothetical protein
VEVFYNPEKSSLFAACDIFPQQAEKKLFETYQNQNLHD